VDANLPAVQKTLADYCQIREKTLGLLRESMAMHELAEQTFLTAYAHGLPCERRIYTLKDYAHEIDARLWRQAFNLTGFMQLMDRQALAEFNTQNTKEPAAFTIENVRATFLSLFQDADEMFARGLVNTFRRLNRYYKTNDQAFKLERKAILTHIFQVRCTRGLEVNYGAHATGTLNDLDRVFHVLDGQKHAERRLETALNASFERSGPWVYEDSYFQIKGFRNGNAHILFKRDDLLEKANRVIHNYYDGRALAEGH